MLRILLISFLLLSACDPGVVLRGAVLDARSAQPVEGATVVLRNSSEKRPDGDTVLLAATDAKGSFVIGSLGAFAPDSQLEIRKDGFSSTVTTLREICPTIPKNARCSDDFDAHYQVEVKLAPLDGEKN